MKKLSIHRYLNLPPLLLEKIKKHILKNPGYENVLEFIIEAIEEKIRLDILVDYNEKTSNSDYGDDECLPPNDKRFPDIFPEDDIRYAL